MHLVPLIGGSLAAILVARAIAIYLLSSAYSKTRQFGAFRMICAAWPGVAWLGPANVAVSVVLGEFVLALAILSPEPELARLGLIAAALWIFAATMLVAWRWRRGESRFRCGCGTDISAESSALGLLLRNVAFMLAMIAAIPGVDAAPRTFWTATTLNGIALGLVLSARLLSAAGQARSRIREWSIIT
jgi:hypothetical protein